MPWNRGEQIVIGIEVQDSDGDLVTSPTVVAGDIQYWNGAAYVNPATLPTVSGSRIQITISSAENDVSDKLLEIRGYDQDQGSWTWFKLGIALGGAESDEVSALEGKVDVIDGNVDSILEDTGTTLPGTLATIDGNVDAILVDTAELQSDDVPGLISAAEAAIRGADDDTLKTLSEQLDGVSSLGAGSIETTITINDGDGDPIDGVDVWVSTDAGGANIIARGDTDDSGEVTFWLDAGTYYVWQQLAGYTFTNPQTLEVSA